MKKKYKCESCGSLTSSSLGLCSNCGRDSLVEPSEKAKIAMEKYGIFYPAHIKKKYSLEEVCAEINYIINSMGITVKEFVEWHNQYFGKKKK